jgi:hypothetical protein
MLTFPSVSWFEALRQAMLAHLDTYQKLGSVDLTLVPTITFPDGHVERYALAFGAQDDVAVKQIASTAEIVGPRVIIEGDYAAWREMVENICTYGGADLQHTLNYLTLPDWPLRVTSSSEQDQRDVHRFYRYQESLQEFFNEAAAVATEFAA